MTNCILKKKCTKIVRKFGFTVALGQKILKKKNFNLKPILRRTILSRHTLDCRSKLCSYDEHMKFIKLNQNKQCELEHERRPVYIVWS